MHEFCLLSLLSLQFSILSSSSSSSFFFCSHTTNPIRRFLSFLLLSLSGLALSFDTTTTLTAAATTNFYDTENLTLKPHRSSDFAYSVIRAKKSALTYRDFHLHRHIGSGDTDTGTVASAASATPTTHHLPHPHEPRWSAKSLSLFFLFFFSSLSLLVSLSCKVCFLDGGNANRSRSDEGVASRHRKSLVPVTASAFLATHGPSVGFSASQEPLLHRQGWRRQLSEDQEREERDEGEAVEEGRERAEEVEGGEVDGGTHNLW